MTDGETVERVLLNPNNGKLAVGIRVQFPDKAHTEELGGLPGYSLAIRYDEIDGWILDNEHGIWIYVPTKLMGKIEDLGSL